MGRLCGKIILKEKLEKQIEGKIGEDQAGFRAGRSYIDQYRI